MPVSQCYWFNIKFRNYSKFLNVETNVSEWMTQFEPFVGIDKNYCSRQLYDFFKINCTSDTLLNMAMFVNQDTN